MTSVWSSIWRPSRAAALDQRDELQHVFCCGPAVVDDEVAVDLRHARGADRKIFQAEFVDQFCPRAWARGS